MPSTQTLPAPHCELNRHASLGGTHSPATQTSSPAHGCSASQPQLAPVQSGSSHSHLPSMHTVPGVSQSSAIVQLPGTGVGGGSAGDTHWPYDGPVGIREARVIHVVERWQFLGSAADDQALHGGQVDHDD